LFNTAVRLARYEESQPDFTGEIRIVPVYLLCHSFLEISLETLLLLDRGIDAMSNFHRDKYQFLLKKEEEIRKNFGLSLERSEPTIGEHLDCCQLEELLSAVVEVNKDFQKLQWYFRVNTEAINRIYSKIDRCGGSSCQLHQHKLKWLEKKVDCDVRCARDAEILTSLTTEVHRSLVLVGSRLTKNSARLTTLRKQSTQHKVFPDLLHCMVIEDQPSELGAFLEKLSFDYGANTPRFRELVYKLAEISVAYGSKNSVSVLLSEAFQKFGVDIDNGLLIRMILHLGRHSARREYNGGEITSLCGHKKQRNEVMASCFFLTVQLLDQKKKDTFLAKDAIGRTCLHYAALYGLHIICQSILEPALLSKRPYAPCLILSVDAQGYTPLHYAVINNHTAVTDMFLAALDLERTTSRGDTVNDVVMLLDELLFIAIRYQYRDIICLLGERRSGCDTRSAEGETALHVAARTGNEEVVEYLLRAGWIKCINDPETTRGWTPLVIACAQGHSAVTKLLLQAGARQDAVDNIGWTAKEHAALRGHLCVSEMLDSWNTFNLPWSSPSMNTKPVSGAQAHLLPGYCHVIINLGAIQKGTMTKALVLNPSSERYSCTGGCLSLDLAISGGNDTGRTVELPILNDMVNEPFIFPVPDPSKILLAFRLYRARSFHAEGRAHMGSGVALLSSLNDCFGTDRESLIRERTVPILEKDTLMVLGTVTFTFLIARPMSPPNISARNTRTFTTSSLQLVGHRGISSASILVSSNLLTNRERTWPKYR
jgi:glycerophosphodiester phosphodiesterase